MMKLRYTHKMLISEYQAASRNIHEANKGLPKKVKIDPDFEIIQNETNITMRINYVDGDGKNLSYNIAL